MAEMKGISIDAYNWLKAKDPSTWSKSHFSTRSKCDILLNNYSECFNKMILEARDKPILTMMKIIRTQMMHRISKKAETAHKYTGPVCPKIQKKMDILIEQAARCWPSHAGGERYEVAFGPFDQHVVNLQTRDCSCWKWGLTGIPCAHAVSVLLLEQHRPEEYVNECYHTSTQIAIYSNLIYPIRGANQWEPIPVMEPILPPIQRRPLGHNVRTCRGQVRSNIRHNTPLVATPIASAPLTPPESPHLSPPATAPPFPAPLAPAPSVSAPSIIDRATKLPFQRSTKVHLKRTAGRQISPQQPAPYQVVRWMMQQTTNSENVLPTSQESIGSFKPKTN
ncbi:hypothetical protein V6N13_110606 [Hibiscus sabdariffa]